MAMALADRAWCVVVPHHARGARQARHRLMAELAAVVPPELLSDTVAVVAELVGNAIRHANPLPGDVVRVAWRLRAGADGDVVEVRVTDGGAESRFPRLRNVPPEAPSGRGLGIVAALSDQWGVDRDGLGQCVWATLGGLRPAGAPRER